MPLPIPTTPESVYIDATGIARATALIPASQDAYNRYVVDNPGAPPTLITLGDVYTGAVRVGLNYWKAPAYWQAVPSPTQPRAPTFSPNTGTGVVLVTVDVWTVAVTQATAIRSALANVPTLVNILGCALCTGLAIQSGLYLVQGPFTP